MNKVWDKLYSKSSSGKIIEWQISVIENDNFSEIITETGQKDGVKTKHVKKILSGKNIGKKNETTHFTQAVQEAQSKWNKRKETSVTNLDDSVIFDIRPMLAHKFKDYKHKLKFPVYVQPKLDGYRSLFNPNTNTFYTRTGKEYSNVENLKNELQKLNISKSLILDGELYNHNIKFEEFGCLRQTKNKEENINIEYHVYDLIDTSDLNKSFNDRLEILKQLIKDSKSIIKLVDTKMAKTEKEINDLHKNYIEQNYEGTMIRNNSIYKLNYRSQDLLKLKDFDDAEFKIVGFEEEYDTLTNEKMIIFICETDNKKTFKVGSKGTKQERKLLLDKVINNKDKYIGKLLSVQYFGLTDNGIPRFPKTLRNVENSIREIE
jgi:ATP-dependent DNA ligase